MAIDEFDLGAPPADIDFAASAETKPAEAKAPEPVAEVKEHSFRLACK